jgi:hypothetical protein
MAAASWMAARKWWPACRSGRRCGGVLEAPEHALDGLAAAVRRQAAGAAPAPGARLDLARRRCVPLPRAHAQPQGHALRLLSPHRLSAARRGVIAQSADTIARVPAPAASRAAASHALSPWWEAIVRSRIRLECPYRADSPPKGDGLCASPLS